MKRAVKKAKLPLFVIKHVNTCKGSAEFGQTFNLTYLRREDVLRSAAYLTDLGVAFKVIEPKIAV